jgi:hypothetical protein
LLIESAGCSAAHRRRATFSPIVVSTRLGNGHDRPSSVWPKMSWLNCAGSNPRIQLGSLRIFAMFSRAVPTFRSFLGD